MENENKYNEGIDKLRKWITKNMNLGKTYNETMKELFTYREEGSKAEKELYEIFAYCDEDVWQNLEGEINGSRYM